MSHPLQCRCGALRGYVSAPQECTRLVCYCKDCQAFARFLGDPARILDPMGGTNVVVAHPRQVAFTHGLDKLASMSLSDSGMYRWYASCCNTAIGNTSRNMKMAFVGLTETCLKHPGASLDAAFGPVRMRSVVKSATGTVEPTGWRAIPVLFGFASSLLGARLSGSYRNNPFFTANGSPLVQSRVLNVEERARLD